MLLPEDETPIPADVAAQIKTDAPEVEPDDQAVLGPDDETGTAPAELLSARAVAVFVPALMAADSFAALALAQVGKPYVLGAEAQISNANPPRFDCSELAEWLFGRNATPIGDLAAAQYSRTKVATGTPRVGDLVFLRNNPARSNGIGHVAVVVSGKGGIKHVGAGQYEAVGEPVIVEARGRAYGVVKTTLSYWKTRRYYTGLRRFPGFKLAAPAVVTPTKPTSAAFRVGQVNLELWGGTQTAASWKARGAWLRDVMRCSVLLLCETSPALPSYPGDMRAALLAELGTSWKIEARQELAVAYDGAKWERADDPRSIMYGVYQGALLVPLRHRASGLGIDFISLHVRPGAVFPASAAAEAGKHADIRAAFGLAKKWPVIIGGDANTRDFRDLLPTGYLMATPDIQTQSKGHLDHVAVRSGLGGLLTVRSAQQADPGPLSDHSAWVVGATITASTPTT